MENKGKINLREHLEKKYIICVFKYLQPYSLKMIMMIIIIDQGVIDRIP